MAQESEIPTRDLVGPINLKSRTTRGGGLHRAAKLVPDDFCCDNRGPILTKAL
jgi:hypothetical protein